MPFTVKSRRMKLENLLKEFDLVVDVTSKSDSFGVRFSPFYPHGGIPVPFSPDSFAQSVEGIWQGLKVFEGNDVDRGKFEITTMKGIKRTCRKFGTVLGHRRGVGGEELLDYLNARYQIYLPAYKWLLDNRLQPELEKLRELGEGKKAALLDYETNCDLENLKKPLSHAYLITRYLAGDYPAKPLN